MDNQSDLDKHKKIIDNDDLVNLQFQDANLHNQLIETLDELIFKSINSKLEIEFSNDDNDILLDKEIENELLNLKDFESKLLSINDEFNLNEIENYLKNMVKIRNDIINQQLISDAYENNELDLELLKKNYDLTKMKTDNFNELSDNLKKLNDLKISNKIKLNKIQELFEIQNNNNNYDNYNENTSKKTSEITNEELEEVKTKYKKIIGKNLMLGHFITDLISALNCTNIANDDKLLEILMDCGDYSDYDLLYEEI